LFEDEEKEFPEECIEAAGGDVALNSDPDFMEAGFGGTEHAAGWRQESRVGCVELAPR
jgi:hypothetical protein